MDGPAWMDDEDLRDFLATSRASNYTCSEIASLIPTKFPNYKCYSKATVKRYYAHDKIIVPAAKWVLHFLEP